MNIFEIKNSKKIQKQKLTNMVRTTTQHHNTLVGEVQVMLL